MKTNLKLLEQIPKAYQPLLQWDQMLNAMEIDPLQRELIKVRTSQLNGCALCLNKHSAEAIKLGEKPGRLAVLSAWREATNWFSEKDQLILELTEEVTLIAELRVREALLEKAIAVFGELTTSQIILAIISMNAWTRIGVAFHMQPQ